MPRQLVLMLTLLVLLPFVAADLYFPGSFNPAKTAPLSDVIVHGTVIDVTPVGDPTIKVIEVLKGEPENEYIKVYTQKRGMAQSEYGTFYRGEEVIIMLQEHNGTYPYEMTHSRATKYGIRNGTIRIKEPVNKRITVEQMKEIIANPDTVNITNMSIQHSTEDDMPKNYNETTQPTGAITSEEKLPSGLFTRLWQAITALL